MFAPHFPLTPETVAVGTFRFVDASGQPRIETFEIRTVATSEVYPYEARFTRENDLNLQFIRCWSWLENTGARDISYVSYNPHPIF